MHLIEFKEITKTYGLGERTLPVLHSIDMAVRQGEFMAIMGPSGSGKSTVLNLLGLLDRPTSGRYFLQGQDVSQLDDDTRSDIRCRKIGVVFQFFNLFPQFSVMENVCVPMQYADVPSSQMIQRATDLLCRVGLKERLTHRPGQLSGGECQRVAIARALANDPPIVLADEPTGNLDAQTGSEIIDVFRKLAGEGRTVIMVTHNADYVPSVDRVVRLLDGRVVRE